MENPRIEELKRRVEKDPTSIAFAQLAEEYRRSGDYQQAVDICRDGLSRHPGYVSARVTLARSLMELDQLAEAKSELQAVLSTAPDNLAAIRALADIHQKTGDADETYEMHSAPRPPAPEPDSEPERPVTESPLDVLGSLSLDLPPVPDTNWDLNAALPPLDDVLKLDDALMLDDALAVDDGAVAESPVAAPAPPPPADPLLGALEGWLDAILADRAHSR